ncbi:hypothetical protein, partial [Rubneribacter badeniensis]|uniref:hypothetical protein n=1 Tax=Rubneribacter badeniensis TaxID=2070688 RepID=UPI00195A33AC
MALPEVTPPLDVRFMRRFPPSAAKSSAEGVQKRLGHEGGRYTPSLNQKSLVFLGLSGDTRDFRGNKYVVEFNSSTRFHNRVFSS